MVPFLLKTLASAATRAGSWRLGLSRMRAYGVRWAGQASEDRDALPLQIPMLRLLRGLVCKPKGF